MTSAEGKSKRSGKREGRTRQSESRAGSTNALQVLAAENRSFLVWTTQEPPGWRSKCWNIKLRISWFLSASGVMTGICGSESGSEVRAPYSGALNDYKTIIPRIGPDPDTSDWQWSPTCFNCFLFRVTGIQVESYREREDEGNVSLSTYYIMSRIGFQHVDSASRVITSHGPWALYLWSVFGKYIGHIYVQAKIS